MCGSAYNVSLMGLNQYLVVLAATGTGKEGANQAAMRLLHEVGAEDPSLIDFIGPGEISSGPALTRELQRSPDLLCFLGEVGLKIQAMTDPRAAPHDKTLHRALLDVYGKSGRDGKLGRSVLADTTKNIAATSRPSLTFVGEGTPDSFLKGIDLAQVASGLIPRLVVLYHGNQQGPHNEEHVNATIPEGMVDQLRYIAGCCSRARERNEDPINVGISVEAEARRLAFRDRCDFHHKKAKSDVVRGMWSRAYLSAWKLAALIAVGVNADKPVIELDHLDWAINLVVGSVKFSLDRFDSGEVGAALNQQGPEQHRERDVARTIVKMLKSDFDKSGSHGSNAALRKKGVLQYSVLLRITSALASFKKTSGYGDSSKGRAVDTVMKDFEAMNFIGWLGPDQITDLETELGTNFRAPRFFVVTKGSLAKLAGQYA
jgi:hypothetical protein